MDKGLYNMKKLLRSLLLVALVFLFLACTSQNGGSETSVAPGFTLPDLSGKMAGLSDYKGQVVLLNFWATWCPPCRAEIPDLIALQEQYSSEGFSILGVSLDSADIDKVRQFSQERRITYRILYAGQEIHKISKDYGNIRGIPTSFLIDREGRIVKKIVGVVDKSVWQKEIEAVLHEQGRP